MWGRGLVENVIWVGEWGLAENVRIPSYCIGGEGLKLLNDI